MVDKNVLEQLLFFLTSNRKNGTTTTLVKALEQTPNALLVVSNSNIRRDVVKNYNISRHRILILNDFNKIRGINLHTPIIFDSDVVFKLINHIKVKDKPKYHDDPQLVYDEYINKQLTGSYFTDDGLMMYTTTSEGEIYSIELQTPFDLTTTIWSTVRLLGEQKYQVAKIEKNN